ncbi:uncharacterized protein METZ01_LOCUS200779, partial [marine metagenome]
MDVACGIQRQAKRWTKIVFASVWEVSKKNTAKFITLSVQIRS